MKRSPNPSRAARRPASAWLRVLAFAVLVVACSRFAEAPSARAQTPTTAFIDRVVASLSVDERLGQLVMVNFVGDDVSAQSDVAALIRDYKVGSVLVTASNGNVVNRGDTPGQLAALTNGLQQRAFESSRRGDGASEYFLPLLIATDNEGDLFPFTNVTNGYTALPNNMTIGATWSKKHAQATGSIVGGELSAAGINMLLGPVVDVLDNPRSGGNGDIGIRSFGGSPVWVGELGRAFVRGVHEGSGGRMLTVAKHFPGHGGSDRSTDNEVPTVNKSLDQLRAAELAPFAEVDRQDDKDTGGATDGMMVSHIRYRNFLGTGAPFTPPISLDNAAFNGFMELPEFARVARGPPGDERLARRPGGEEVVRAADRPAGLPEPLRRQGRADGRQRPAAAHRVLHRSGASRLEGQPAPRDRGQHPVHARPVRRRPRLPPPRRRRRPPRHRRQAQALPRPQARAGAGRCREGGCRGRPGRRRDALAVRGRADAAPAADRRRAAFAPAARPAVAREGAARRVLGGLLPVPRDGEGSAAEPAAPGVRPIRRQSPEARGREHDQLRRTRRVAREARRSRERGRRRRPSATPRGSSSPSPSTTRPTIRPPAPSSVSSTPRRSICATRTSSRSPSTCPTTSIRPR